MSKSNFLAAALMLGLATPALAADPALGLYQTQPDDNGNFGHVEIYECGNEICGVIRAAFDGSGQPVESENIGKRIVWEMQSQGGGKYGDGKIYAPDRDKTYNSKMELSGNTLSVSGCVLVICRSQTWTRVK